LGTEELVFLIKDQGN